LPQTHHSAIRTWHRRSERSGATLRDSPLGDFAAGALGFSAQRHCSALRWQARLQHGRGSRCSQIQLRRRTISHSRASCQWSCATERRVACRETGSSGGLVIRSLRCRNVVPQARGRPTSLRRSYRCASRPCLGACDGATVVLRGPVWPRLVQQQSELGADGRCNTAWLPPRRSRAAICVVCTKRSLMEPATLKYQLRPSQRIVHALAVGDAAMVSARISLHWHVNGRGNWTVAGRVANV
jgi:hypothetical protein